jgi:methionyl-tRNA synthetase
MISARSYLDRLDPSYLRFFYALSLGGGPEDLDLSLAEFRQRVNAELVNNIGNLANRALSLVAGPLEKQLAPAGDGPGRKLVEDALARVPEVREAFERLDYRAALKVITEISGSANGFLQSQAPWAQVKKDKEAARRDLSDAADVVYLVAGLIAPVVPRLSAKLFAQLNAPELTWEKISTAKYPLLDRSRGVGQPEPLIGRIEEDQVNALVASPEGAAKKVPAAAPAAKAAEKKPEKKAEPAAAPGEIEYADFARVDLRVGRILTVERIPKADKLYKLTVDVGEESPRTIAAGIAEAYTSPEQLVGRSVVVVANLKPRALRGIESRGMLLAAGPGGKDLSLVDPGPLKPGSEVK